MKIFILSPNIDTLFTPDIKGPLDTQLSPIYIYIYLK